MNERLDGGAVKEVERLAKSVAQVVQIGGVDYSTVALHDQRKPDHVPIGRRFSTLASFCEYVASDSIDAEYRGTLDSGADFVHVTGPTRVDFCSSVTGKFRPERVTVVTAEAITPDINFNLFLDPETFTIMLMSKFEKTADRDELMKVVGTLRSEAVQTVSDDGISQNVIVRAGMVRDGTVTVDPIRTLRPYLTFREVTQPESQFLLRMRSGGDGKPPSIALFQCDNAQWQIAAVKAVCAALAAQLPDGFPILG